MDLHKYIFEHKFFKGYDEYERKVKEELLRDNQLIFQLNKCIQFGVRNDIVDLVSTVFDIPLGLKWKLINLFASFQCKNDIIDNDITECGDQHTNNEIYAINLFRKLMNGTELCNIFETLKSDLQNNFITNSSYLKYEELFLDIGGHQSRKYTHANFDAMKRFRIIIDNLKTFEIKSIHISNNGEYAYMHENNQYYMIHQSGKVDVIPTNQMQLCESGKLWWRFVKCAQDIVYSRDYFPLNTLVSLANICIRPYLVIGDSVSLKVVQPDTEELLTITLDINSIISVDCHTAVDDIVSCVLMVEGRISNTAGFGYHDVFNEGKSEIGDDSSLSQYSTDEDDDTRYFLPALAAVKSRYYVCFCLCHQTITSITNVIAVNNLILDQVPTTIKMLSDSTAIVYGTNALLSKVVKGESFLFADVLNDYDDSSIYSSSIFNIVSDDSNMPLLYHSTSSQISHEFNSHITAVSYTKDENICVSGDSRGCICFWSLTNKNHSILLYPRLQLITECRIMSINIAPTGKHCCVALYDRVILLGVTSDDKELYIRASLDIVEGYRMFYCTAFLHDNIQIWRFSADPYSNKTVATGWKHKNIDQLKNRRVDIKDICRMAIEFRSTNDASVPMMKLINDNENDNAAAEYMCKEYSVQTFRQQLFSSECSKNIVKEFMTGYTSTYDAEQSDDDLNPSIAAPFSTDTIAVEVTTDSGISENSVYFYHHLFNQEMETNYMALMTSTFVHDRSIEFIRALPILSILSILQINPISLGLIGAALDIECLNVYNVVSTEKFLNLVSVVHMASATVIELEDYVINPNVKCPSLFRWLSSKLRAGREFYIDDTIGHSYLCSVYLKYCSNKSVAVEHKYQDYLRTYGPFHFRHSGRSLRELTQYVRKIDETAMIKNTLPRQLGYVSGLQEIYARRVRLTGRIPEEISQLKHLRVLSMGNNALTGPLPESLSKLSSLQRIVLHQNKLTGLVPIGLSSLGCIVNLAGNNDLEQGPNASSDEIISLVDLYHATNGVRWLTKSNWCSSKHVSSWYKIGMLHGGVHSLVMSSNGMDGCLPTSIGKLKQLRMIELATMPGLRGIIPSELCSITSLKRLCICRCNLSGPIPDEIGKLIELEELQLFGNQLSGFIPSSISKLINLKLLSFGEYTGGNAFTSAPLPICIKALINLEALFMANCNITGPLPHWINNLKELRQLDLQRNGLSGELVDISALSQLLYLNLKDNHNIVGKLPVASLSKLSKLNRLSLVNTSFSNDSNDVALLQAKIPRCKIWI